MKAVRFSQFGGPEVLKIVDLPDLQAGPGQIRVAVRGHTMGVSVHGPALHHPRTHIMILELPGPASKWQSRA